jgi:hypothetical protein
MIEYKLPKLLDKLDPEKEYFLYLVAVPVGKEDFWQKCQPHETKVVSITTAQNTNGEWDL